MPGIRGSDQRWRNAALLLFTSLLAGWEGTTSWVDAAPPGADPDYKDIGYWDSGFELGFIAIHGAVLRGAADSSIILLWAGGPGTQHAGSLWKPNPNETLSGSSRIYSFDVLGDTDNLLCAGHSTLADGRLIVIGGTESSPGLDHTNVFDATIPYDPTDQAAQWVSPRPPDMNVGRWYPTSTTLADGSVLSTGGAKWSRFVSFFGSDGDDVQNDIPADFALRDELEVLSTTSSGSAPAARQFLTAVPLGGETVFFGGEDEAGDLVETVAGQLRTYVFDASTELGLWSNPALGSADSLFGRPVQRSRHSAILDVQTNRMIIFGGRDSSGNALRDVWALSLNPPWKWSKLLDVPTSDARWGHSACFDATSDTSTRRMLVFGGQSDPTTYHNEVFALTLSGTPTWNELSASGEIPTPRQGHTAVVNRYTGNNQLLVFGGGNANTLFNELRALELATGEWKLLDPYPDGAYGVPASRQHHASIADATWDRLIVYGGDTDLSSSTGEVSDVWSLKLTYGAGRPQWKRDFGTLATGPRARHVAVFDSRTFFARIPERYVPSGAGGGTWTLFSGALYHETYPFMFQLPSGSQSYNGKVFLAGPKNQGHLFDPSAGTITNLGDDSGFLGGTAVMYRPGHILKSGGKAPGSSQAVTSTKTIDVSGTTSAPTWTSQSPMAQRRQEHNLTILPDGNVLLTGGIEFKDDISENSRRQRPVLWDAVNHTWTTSPILADDPAIRNYHSIALLLPDGRILSAGGDLPTNADKTKATVFYPPCLFDSAGSLADRPVIDAAPDTVVPGHSISIFSSEAAEIASACLIRPAAVTHAFDQNQRYVPLNIKSRNGEELILAGPVDVQSAPPGDYMAFLVNSAGVPSVATWTRVRADSQADTCTNASPATVTGLIAPDTGRYSIRLTWTAPGENGNCGTAYRYDVRRSTSTITEANFYSATPVLESVWFGSAGSDQCMEVDSLASCVTYYFALKTRDASGVWSKMSNVASATTQCSGTTIVFCDGGGLLTGGGDGGGGEDGFQGMNLASTSSAPQLISEQAVPENSILWPSTSRVLDLHRIGVVASQWGYSLRLRQAGHWNAAIDQLSLGVVDHDPVLTAIAGTDSVLLGTITSLSSVTDAAGQEVSGLEGDGTVQPLLRRTGDNLFVRLSGGSVRTALVIESGKVVLGDDTDAPGILVQKPGPETSWVTLARVQPRRGFDRVAVPSQGSGTLRLTFGGDYVLRSLAQLDVVEAVAPQLLGITTADHSRLGSTLHAVGESGGAEVSLNPGESIDLAFASTPTDPGQVRDFFLMARGSYQPANEAASTELAGSPSELDRAWTFEVGAARPNPSLGGVVIEFSVARQCPVGLRVYNVAGRLVRTLVNRELPAGPQKATWDGRDETGHKVASGVYFYRMDAAGWRSEKKVVMMRP